MSKSIKIRLRQQIRTFKQSFFQLGGLPLNDILPSSLFQKIVDSGSRRDQIFTPLVTLKAFIFQVLSDDGSCQETVARVLSERLQNALPANSINTGPYCKARQRLPLTALIETVRTVGKRLYQKASERWRWKGFNVVMADGTTVLMPDTPANQTVFPQQSNQKPGLGFPITRMVALVSLSVGSVIDYATGPYQGKGSGETSLFSTLIGSLSKGDLLLADRYYCTYAIVAMLLRRHVTVVFRNHPRKKVDFRRGKKRGAKDHIIHWHKPPRKPVWLCEQDYALLPDVLPIREFSVNGIVYVTTLMTAKVYPKRELADLYGQRWKIELDLRTIKTHMGMEMLRCKSPEMVQKEIAVHLLAYNLIRITIAQAAKLHDQIPRRLSFKAAVQLINNASVQFVHITGEALKTILYLLLDAIASTPIGQRKRRNQPRAIKRRPKAYPLLTKPRCELV